MVQQATAAIENNFTKGLVTEFTGLNFPPNAATDTDNCTYTLVGDVTRREGIDFETNFNTWNIDRSGAAVDTYKWNNAGGDGQTEVLVVYLNGILHFWKSSAATTSAPLSNQILASTVDVSTFVATGGSFDKTQECQFSSGNGYLFVCHPSCDPFYCTYTSGTIAGNKITVKIRDFSGINEPNVPVDFRPTALTDEHQYNLTNQGWVSGNAWSAASTTSINVQITSRVFTVPSGIVGVVLGTTVAVYFTGSSAVTGIPNGPGIMSGTVTAYSGTSMTINVTAIHPGTGGLTGANWQIIPKGSSYLSTWNAAIGNYPSNADVWWYFKNASGVFDPATVVANISLATGKAPGGHYILDAFSQQRDILSGISSLTDVSTTARPKATAWFQGRVWYAGVDAQQAATGDAAYYTWTENIYFSQIVTDTTSFGSCYQTNDPTSETLFDLLPTDGGVIQIQGCGSIYKLFPVQNGLLVFAANGIWFLTGSQGIGFSANDYTPNRVSEVKTISGTSFVNVLGYPFFWNEEGIYSVTPSQQGLQVEPITVGTIQTFYDDIPAMSKKYVRGAYHPIDYTIQWIYRDTLESSVTDRYQFNRILNYNTYNKAFFPYTVSAPHVTINSINYVSNPTGITSPDPMFKYLVSNLSPTGITWADEHDTDYLDFSSDDGGANYDSYFITGFRLAGQALHRFQMPYIYTFSRNDIPNSFKIQGLWDYANTGDSGRWSTPQLVSNWSPQYSTMFRRHRIRGQGLVLQIKVTSVTGQPFDLMGWSMPLQVNASV